MINEQKSFNPLLHLIFNLCTTRLQHGPNNTPTWKQYKVLKRKNENSKKKKVYLIDAKGCHAGHL